MAVNVATAGEAVMVLGKLIAGATDENVTSAGVACTATATDSVGAIDANTFCATETSSMLTEMTPCPTWTIVKFVRPLAVGVQANVYIVQAGVKVMVGPATGVKPPPPAASLTCPVPFSQAENKYVTPAAIFMLKRHPSEAETPSVVISIDATPECAVVASRAKVAPELLK
jgi:hypothetical protein